MKPSEISVQRTVWVKIPTRSNIILVDNAKYPIGFKKVKKKDTSVTFKSKIAQIIGAKKATIALEKLTGTPLFIKLVFRLNLTITTQKVSQYLYHVKIKIQFDIGKQ